MQTANLLDQLRTAEVRLHGTQIRQDHEQLCQLLHANFVEIGRTGLQFDRANIIEALKVETPYRVWSQDYELQVFSPELVLLRYKSAKLLDDDQLANCAVRSSIWKLEAENWQMIFHQGTAIEAFKKTQNYS
ncbi:DUF4440 domain-containing protein [Chitinibacter fontanus]|uniref:DUF4440 domain-containing protein n=1 Tax=Chitinibacter fontanus TaxID=1737446 RepID=A0A7D5VAF2_9NEIS|nr:DUF4440 domain-containing protein [Chitinibacter fontanus]QLI82191.1 DUF4440 domain-containing protein [Chitinibacter fontanus]